MAFLRSCNEGSGGVIGLTCQRGNDGLQVSMRACALKPLLQATKLLIDRH